MRDRLILLSFGMFMGLLLTGIAYPVFKYALNGSQEATHFGSVEDFQRAMLARDERDERSDQSVSLRSIIVPHHDPLLMYDLLPGTSVPFQGEQVDISACGMRDKDYSVEKPDNTFRIAVLGDSFTFGWGVKEHEAFPSVLERNLNYYFSDAVNIEVLNFGVPGYSTFQQAALFENRVKEFNPDAVLVFFIENDFGLPFFITNVHSKGDLMASTVFAKRSWAGDDQAVNKQNALIMDEIDPNKALIKILQSANALGAQLFVAINPRPDWKEDKNRLWALRKRKRIHHIALREPFMEIVRREGIDPKDLSLAHDPHPSPLKHKMLGDLLSAAFHPVVSRVTSEQG